MNRSLLFRYTNGIEYNGLSPESLYMFDLDGTIITTMSGKTFPVDSHDYKFLMIPKCTHMSRMIIYTNQYSVDIKEFETKLYEIMQKITDENKGMVSITAFVATQKDENRKPIPFGLFDSGILEGVEKLIYVGDAAGREGDHSDTDYKFALNIRKLSKIRSMPIDVYFYTPEEFINSGLSLDDTPVPVDAHMSTRGLTIDYPDFSNKGYTSVAKKCEGYDLIICCGRQGSGKSTTVSDLSKNGFTVVVYTNIGQTFGKVSKLIAAGNKVLVDGTFPAKDTRNKFLSTTEKSMIIWFNTDEEVCKHNRKYRETVLGVKTISSVVIRVFESKFEEPTTDEADIIVIKTTKIKKNDTPEYQLYYF